MRTARNVVLDLEECADRVERAKLIEADRREAKLEALRELLASLPTSSRQQDPCKYDEYLAGAANTLDLCRERIEAMIAALEKEQANADAG